MLPHVPGDGNHGVSVERGDPRAERQAKTVPSTQMLRYLRRVDDLDLWVAPPPARGSFGGATPRMATLV